MTLQVSLFWGHIVSWNKIDDALVIPSGEGQEMIWDFQSVFKSLMGGKGDSLLDNSLALTFTSAN